jgi:outer membrane protein TolC
MDSKLALAEEVHLLTVRIDTARREALVFGGEIASRSRQAVESARSAWATGQGTLYELLEARRMYLEASWMAARAVAEQYMALSELALCCGLGDLEALQMLHALPGPAVNAPSAPQP